MGARTRTAIIVSLVAYAFILGAFSTVVPPLSALVLKPNPFNSGATTSFGVTSSQSLPPSSTTGTLVVKASLSNGDGTAFPVPHASVLVTLAGSTSPLYDLATNSSGMVQISVESANYSILITAPSFHVTAQAQVYPNRVTEVDLVSNNASFVINTNEEVR